MTPEVRAKISIKLVGRTQTDEHRAANSAGVRKAFAANPEILKRLHEGNRGRQPMLGKRHSEETRRKMSEAHKARAARKLELLDV